MLGWDYLSEILWVTGSIAAAAAFLLLYALYRQASRPARQVQSPSTPNLTEAAILFQTLRGIIHDQKNLAREFNASFDKKVGFVREFMTKAANEIGALQAQLRDLATQVETAKADLAAIQKAAEQQKSSPQRASYSVETQTAPTREREPDFILHAPPKSSGATRHSDADTALLHVVAAPDDPEDFINSWSGFDFAGVEEQDEFDIPETVPEAPGDPETAREAFRTLLNIQPEPSRNNKPDFGAAVIALPRDAEPARARDAAARTDAESGNGRDKSAPLRGRVYEYYDAGMTVSEISRELGIGKGEVRLMLNLRDRTEKFA